MTHPEYAECFEWDDAEDERGNTAHLAETRIDRRGIDWCEAEEVFANDGKFAPNKRNRSGDWLLIGQTDAGRMLTLVLTYDTGRRVIRVFTGWDTTAGERSRYL